MAMTRGITEAEWLGCADPRPMHEAVRGTVSERKLRLFAVACCRGLGPLLKDPRITTGLDVADRYADGAATRADLEAALQGAARAQRAQRRKALLYAYAAVKDACSPAGLALGAAEKSAWAAAAAADSRATYGERLRQTRPDLYASLAALLRDVLGNPFRPVAVDLSWLTSAVVRLAQGIYDDRAFDRLPTLADALEQAGCTDAEILGHCRQPGTHARGCWVVDGVLQRD
jgi:hypothetical protein